MKIHSLPVIALIYIVICFSKLHAVEIINKDKAETITGTIWFCVVCPSTPNTDCPTADGCPEAICIVTDVDIPDSGYYAHVCYGAGPTSCVNTARYKTCEIGIGVCTKNAIAGPCGLRKRAKCEFNLAKECVCALKNDTVACGYKNCQ